MSSGSSQLLDLPVELVIRILEPLDPKSLLRVSETCYLFRSIVKDTISMQYHIALAATNTAEPSTHIPTPFYPWTQRNKLEEIKRRERAWMGLTFEAVEETPMEMPSGVYELQHGVFAQGTRSASNSSQSGGLRIIHLGHSRTSAHGILSGTMETSSHLSPPEDLPSSSSPHSLPRSSTLEYKLGFDFADFNIDPEQDLAIYACTDNSKQLSGGMYRLGLVETHLRIRKLSENGAPHPHARSEKLDLGVAFQRGVAFFIQIFGDFVGVLTRSISGLQAIRDNSELVIYNWKTGVLQTRHRRKHIANFIFLSSSSFMLVSNHDPAGFLVYRFKPLRNASNAIPGWSEAGPEPLTPWCIASYLLPNLHPRAEAMGEIVCRCEPTPVFEPPDYEDEDNALEDETTVVDEVMMSGRSDGADLDHKANASEESGKPRQESQDQPKAYPMPTPSLVVRPGQDDFRVAVITYGIQRETYVEDFIGFIAISELFKDARERDRVTAAHRDSVRNTAKAATQAEADAVMGVNVGADTEEGVDPDAIPSEVQKTRSAPRWVIPWQEWGPKWSRFLEGRISISWVCYIYLNRFVLSMPFPPMDARAQLDSDEEGWDSDLGGDREDRDGTRARARRQRSMYICVLDFNPNALHESYPARLGGAWNPLPEPTTDAQAKEGDDLLTDDSEDWETEFSFSRPSKERGVQERTQNTALPLGEDVFAAPITTALPYRKFHSYAPVKGNWIPMIDAERILLVPDDNEDDDDALGPRTIKTLAL